MDMKNCRTEKRRGGLRSLYGGLQRTSIMEGFVREILSQLMFLAVEDRLTGKLDSGVLLMNCSTTGCTA